MVPPEVIRKRLQKLDEYLSILRRMQRYTFAEFSREPEKYGSVERFLLLSIETTLDIGNHIIADLNLGTVNWYNDIPQILFKAQYLDEKLMNTWIKMIGFRNTLIHDYIEIDKNIVYTVLQTNLTDFEKLKKVFAAFL